MNAPLDSQLKIRIEYSIDPTVGNGAIVRSKRNYKHIKDSQGTNIYYSDIYYYY